MAELGLDLVRVGEFASAAYEPERNKFEWGWLDRAIEAISSAGMKIVLGTPTATPPVWLMLERPSVLSRQIRRHLELIRRPLAFRTMPVSKGRKKAKKRPPPPPRTDATASKKGPSPTWYVALMFGLMGVGIVVILLNYVRLLPGAPTNAWLLVGLAGIGVGFGMTLNFR